MAPNLMVDYSSSSETFILSPGMSADPEILSAVINKLIGNGDFAGAVAEEGKVFFRLGPLAPESPIRQATTPQEVCPILEEMLESLYVQTAEAAEAYPRAGRRRQLPCTRILTRVQGTVPTKL